MKTLVASLALALVAVAHAQNFQNAADCNREYERLRAEAQHFDSAWSDCVAGTAHGTLLNCQNFSSAQRISASKDIAGKRDTLYAQATNLRPMCQQMANNERDQQRASALARDEVQLQQQRAEQQRRQTISTQQYESDRRAEALSAANAEYRTEKLNRQAEAGRQAAQLQRSNTAKAAAIGNLAAALTTMLSSSRTEDDSDSDKYSKTQNLAEKEHAALQKEQSEIVNRIQKAAWDKIREQNLATLQDSSDVTKVISSFTGDSSQKNPWDVSSGRGAQLVSETLENPWQEAKSASNRLRPVVDGAMKSVDSGCVDNPWACDKEDSKLMNKKKASVK